MAKKILYSLFTVLGIGAMCVGIWLLAWGSLSNSWPSTTGRIFSSHLSSSRDNDGATYGAAVTYEYYIGAQRYFSDRVSFGDYNSSDSRHASGILSRYPEGTIVTVYFNPLRPSMSVLEQGAGGGAFIPLGLGAAFVGFVLFMRMAEREQEELVAKAQAAKADAPTIFEPKELRLPGIEKKRITVNRNSPRVLTNYPPSAIIMGLLLVAFGMVIVFHGEGPDAPLIITLGLVVMGAGLSLAWFAYKGVRLRRLRDQASEESPWLYDYPWDRQAASDGGFKPFFKMFSAISGMTAFLVPIQLLMLRHIGEVQGGPIVFLYLIFGLFDLGMLIGFGSAVYLFLRAMKFGTNRVVFHSFPLQPGQDIAVAFAARRLRNQALRAELQCIREYYESSGAGDSRTQSLVFELLYSQAGEFRTDSSGIAKLAFRLPPEAPSTDLAGSPPCYWELVITATVPGIDYKGIFLMPVYRTA